MHYALGTAAKLALGLALCWLAERLYALLHPRERIARELTVRDNAAFAAALGGYLAAAMFALGGVFIYARGGPLREQAATIARWGLLDVALLNAASLFKRHLILRRLALSSEIHRGNLAAGIVTAGMHLANGLLLYGAVSPERGLAQSVGLWAYGQLWLAAAAGLLPYLLRCRLPREIARGNAAVGWACAGALVAAGNLMRLALTGEFWGWRDTLLTVTAGAVVGLGTVLLLSEIVDLALLRGASLRHELVEQKTPNAGLGFLLAALWVGASVLAGWCL